VVGAVVVVTVGAVVVGAVVVGAVVVGGAVVVVGAAVVVVAVVVGVVVVALAVVVVVGVVAAVVADELPLSDAITASATPRPMTTATSSAIAAFIPVLMPPLLGGRSSGSGITRVGSSCIGPRV
jgi:hypothetical protein